jgi:hypothetical protein
MKSIQFKDTKTGEEISIAYSDYGKGQPVVLVPIIDCLWPIRNALRQAA